MKLRNYIIAYYDPEGGNKLYSHIYPCQLHYGTEEEAEFLCKYYNKEQELGDNLAYQVFYIEEK